MPHVRVRNKLQQSKSANFLGQFLDAKTATVGQQRFTNTHIDISKRKNEISVVSDGLAVAYLRKHNVDGRTLVMGVDGRTLIMRVAGSIPACAILTIF